LFLRRKQARYRRRDASGIQRVEKHSRISQHFPGIPSVCGGHWTTFRYRFYERQSEGFNQ
jgi:hypothetical protein